MLERIEHKGQLISGSHLPGETRADGVAPAHPNGLQLSRDRFLLINAALKFRGVDDSTSGLYELRADDYDGPLVKEGFLVRSADDWDPLGDGSAHVRQYGHFAPFGVPKGAFIAGRPAAHGNLFAVLFRVVARQFDPERNYLLWSGKHSELRRRTQNVEWMQFRLNDANDDIEIVQPPRPFRQKGHDADEDICSEDVRMMNCSFVAPVPYNSDASEWIGGLFFEGGKIADCKYAFNAHTGLYEWTETGPVVEAGLREPSVARYRDSWIIAARPQPDDPGRPCREGPVAWMRCDDPFRERPKVVRGEGPIKQERVPLSVFTCADGVLRMVTGDEGSSPYGLGRNPLYMWDVDPDNGFTLSHQRVVFDTIAAGLPISMDHHPIVDMGKILPHAGGRSQVLVHRVRSSALLANDPDWPARLRVLTKGDFDSTGIYHARLHYTEACPSAWRFEEE